MTDDMQRAREQFEAWAAGVSYRGSNIDTTRNDLVPDWYLDPLAALAWRCWQAALRAAPDAVALRTAMTTLEQIASAPDDKGAKFNAASCVAFLTTQGAAGQEWRPIEAAPEGRLVVVGWMDTEDSHYPENYDFDYLEDGLWAKHADCVEHAHAVAPPGSKMPKEQPPYQWWMDLPAFPAARPQGVKSA